METIARTEAPAGLFVAGRPTLLFFHRGRWCPFCNTYLDEMLKQQTQLLAIADVRVISSEPMPTPTDLGLSSIPRFVYMADPKLELIDWFGIRHAAAGPAGRDITKPALAILDDQGHVAWSYVGAFPMDRPPIAAVLEELQRIAGLRTEGHQKAPLERLRASGSLLVRGLARAISRRGA